MSRLGGAGVHGDFQERAREQEEEEGAEEEDEEEEKGVGEERSRR